MTALLVFAATWIGLGVVGSVLGVMEMLKHTPGRLYLFELKMPLVMVLGGPFNLAAILIWKAK